MLVLIGELSLSTLISIIFEVVFLHHFVFAKLASSSIRVNFLQPHEDQHIEEDLYNSEAPWDHRRTRRSENNSVVKQPTTVVGGLFGDIFTMKSTFENS